LEALSDGRLLGWYQAASERGEETVSLHIGGELVSITAPTLERKDVSADDQIQGFEFDVAELLRLGYAGGDQEVSVRVTRMNIPLPGTPVPMGDVETDQRYDAKRDEWVERSTFEAAFAEVLDKLKPDRRVLGGVRRRLRELRGS
jgi:hypothetical protein